MTTGRREMVVGKVARVWWWLWDHKVTFLFLAVAALVLYALTIGRPEIKDCACPSLMDP